jgi:hypothetical protein
VSLVQGECLDCLDPEDRGSRLLRNVGNDIQLNRHYILEDLNLQTLQGLDTSNMYVAWRIATKKTVTNTNDKTPPLKWNARIEITEDVNIFIFECTLVEPVATNWGDNPDFIDSK